MAQTFQIARGEGPSARHEIALVGRVYADAVPALRAALAEAAAASDVVLVDATKLDAIDGAALRAFVELVKTLRARGGRLVFFGLSPLLERTFAVTAFDQLVTILASRDAALAAAR
jgi:anti-anti-sigma factor